MSCTRHQSRTLPDDVCNKITFTACLNVLLKIMSDFLTAKINRETLHKYANSGVFLLIVTVSFDLFTRVWRRQTDAPIYWPKMKCSLPRSGYIIMEERCYDKLCILLGAFG